MEDHLLTRISVNRIKSHIINLQRTSNVEKTLDYIFNTFDDLLIDEQFDLVNRFLENIDINEFEVNGLVGILVITSAWKDELRLRISFYHQVYELVNSMYLSEEANQILDGLE